MLIQETTRKHYEKYAALAKKRGVTLDGLDQFLGRDKDTWTALWKKDPNLNNVRLREWDGAGIGLVALHGWGGNSQAELVCLYKHLVTYQIIGVSPEFTEEG